MLEGLDKVLYSMIAICILLGVLLGVVAGWMIWG